MSEVRERLQPVVDGPLATMLMAGTGKIHREAERVPFMVAFFKGELTSVQYGTYLAQLLPVYEALEATSDPEGPLGSLHAPELFRADALRRDIATYLDSDGDLADASPAAKAYADRIGEVAGTPAWAAHQWLRYLGFVMGQELLRNLTRKSFPETDAGVAFYEFPEIASPKDYLVAHHAKLAALPLDFEQKMDVVDEGYRAFQHTIALTQELAADFGIGQADEVETARLLDALKASHP